MNYNIEWDISTRTYREKRAEDRTLGYVTIWGSKTSRETEFSQMEKEKSDDSKKEKDRQSGTKK